MSEASTGADKARIAAVVLVIGLAANLTGLVSFMTGADLPGLLGWGRTRGEAEASEDDPTTTTSVPRTTTTAEPSTTTTTTTDPPPPTTAEEPATELEGSSEADSEDSRTILLWQGEPAPSGYWYDITLSGFPPNTEVTLICHDSANPEGFLTFTITTEPSGWGWAREICHSADGPEYWVTAGDVESLRLTWN